MTLFGRRRKMANEVARIRAEGDVDPVRVRGFVGYVLRRDEAYLMAVGYAGPGRPIPYWTDELSGKAGAKVWKSLDAARGAMARYGGEVRAARMDGGRLRLVDGWRETAETEE